MVAGSAGRGLWALAAALMCTGAAHADAAADLALLASIDAKLQSTFKPDTRVGEARVGRSMDLTLWDSDPQALSVNVDTESTTVDQYRNPWAVARCRQHAVPLSSFSLVTGYRTFLQAQAIARELGAELADQGFAHMFFMPQAPSCEPRWSKTMQQGERNLDAEFGVDGRLLHLIDQGDGKPVLEAAAQAALDERTRDHTEPLLEALPPPAEAQPLADPGPEYVQAQLGALVFTCSDTLALNYDYDSVELDCELPALGQKFGFVVRGVEPGASVHQNGTVVWYDGLYQYRDHFGATIRFDELSTTLVTGRIDARLESAYGLPIELKNARFRLLPSPGFRVTPPDEAGP
jgi:hypothetical protein